MLSSVPTQRQLRMAERSFSDRNGVAWTVHEVRRTADSAGNVRPELEQGWLLFLSATERRRFGPPPVAWDSPSDAELEELGERALLLKHADALMDELRHRSRSPRLTSLLCSSCSRLPVEAWRA